MRNIILAIIAGPVLFGCLSDDESPTAGDNSAVAKNSAPTIAGNPVGSTRYGETYEFIPNASDADGDTLIFEVENKPNWAKFNTSTGRLSGQPTIADIGDYRGIVISVSDRTNSTSLPVFSIAIVQTALGSVTLSWTAPTQNSDGSALTDLAGYKIYYAKKSGYYDQAIVLDNPSITTYVVEQLSPATYYFAATAVNSMGIESSHSAEIARTVQ